jgi:hypothetical protein
MMALYVYTITDQPAVSVPARPGLEDVLTLNIPYRDIAAVVSPVSTTEIPPTEARLWQHEGLTAVQVFISFYSFMWYNMTDEALSLGKKTWSNLQSRLAHVQGGKFARPSYPTQNWDDPGS